MTVEVHIAAANAALKLGRYGDAAAHLEALVAAAPDHLQFRRLLGVCRLRIGNAAREAGRAADARAAYEAALAADADANDARFNLALLDLDAGAFADAAPRLDAVVAAQPDDEAAHLQLGRALAATGAIDAARAHFARCDWRRALKLAATWRGDAELAAANALLDAVEPPDEPARLKIAIARRLGLPAVYRDARELRETRENFAVGLDRLIADYPPARVAAIDGARDAVEWDNFFLAYQGEDDRELQSRFGAWLCASLESAGAPRPRARTRKRIALVGSFFRECTVGSYFGAWLGALTGAGFETTVFQLEPGFDAWTERFARASSNGLVRLGSKLDENLARIREAAPDLALFPELGMDARVLSLAAARVAPLQACAWGHPVTSGLPTIDAYFSCAEMEPPDARSHYGERELLLLPGLGTRYASPAMPPRASRESLGLPADRTLYLVPQSPFKLHPDNDALLVDVARRDARAAFVMFEGPSRASTRVLTERLGRAGLDFAARLVVLREADRARYLQVNAACDVMIDSLRWSGGNTTLDALHAGLPVVTCPGAMMRGRQSMAMLRRLDCDELVVETPTALAAKAVDVARDAAARERLSRRIAERLRDLVDDPEPLRVLVEHVRSLLA